VKAGLDRDTYLECLRRLDARALLDHYGARNRTEQPNKDGRTTEIVHSCLIDRVEPHHRNGDEMPSASLNVEKRKYTCYAGGWSGDLFHFVMKMEGVEAFSDVLGTIEPFLQGSTVSTATLLTELEAALSQPSSYTVNLPSYDASVLTPWRGKPHPYWAQRGVEDDVIDLLQLGYDPRERRVVFPHFVGDTLVGWQKRVVPGLTDPAVPKYKSSPGFPKTDTLYAHQLTDPGGPVLVVESPASVARAYSLGLRNVVATFGAKVSAQQISLLADHQRVIVWFDADPAGAAGERALLEGLYRHTETLAVVPQRGKDLADILSLIDFAAYTAFHTMPAVSRLAETDLVRHARSSGGR